MSFPFLKNKIVLVKGYEAYGVYDLNQGKFHRINFAAGDLLLSLDGTQSQESFDEDDQKFIAEALNNGLISTQEHAQKHEPTRLEQVIRHVRPVRFAWIEITSKCNQLCAHCFLGDELNRFPHIQKEKIFDYFETLSIAGARQVILSGGEPTVHPNFLEILDKAATYQFSLSVLSNASRRDYTKFIAKFVEYGVTVKIPILGWSESHDKMAGQRGAFERTIQNIRLLNDADVRLELGTTVTGINHKDIARIREFANELQLPLEVSPVYNVGFAKKNAQTILSVAQKEIVAVCQEDKKKPRVPLRQYPPLTRPQYERDATDYDAVNLRDYLTEHHECGQKILAILSSSEVTPCLMLRDRKFSMGSTNQHSLAEILERKADRSAVFDELMSLKKIPGCSGCEARFVCKAGGCPASAFAATGSVQMKNPMFKRCYYLERHADEEAVSC